MPKTFEDVQAEIHNATSKPDDTMPEPEVKVLTLHDFLGTTLPPRETILAPWLKSQSLSMIHAWRGIGKTFVALEISYAVATGGPFLMWTAPKPRGVLFIDGEMPAITLQERLSRIIASSEKEPDPNMFRIVTPDLQPVCVPNLSTVEGQDQIEEIITPETELIVMDNLSCLVRGGGRENDAESWLSVQEWALRLRSRGKSILFIHHSGKTGAQRGTSKREDVLDTVLCLRRPANYEQSKGCSLQIHFEKSRGLAGPEVEPVEALLIVESGGMRTWSHHTAEDALPDIVAELVNLGMTRQEVVRELKETYGKSSATSYRLTKDHFPKRENDSEKCVRKDGKKP